VDPAREVAQVLQRQRGLVPGLAHQLGGVGVAARAALLGHPQRERQRHEPLLRAVVEVALDAAALGVGRLDDARAGVAQVGHLRGDGGVVVGAEQHHRVARVEPPQCAQRRDAEREHHRPERDEQQRLPELIHAKQPVVQPVGDGPVPERQEDAVDARAEHGGGDDQRHQAERELQQQEDQVLPRRRIGQARAQAHPPGGVLGCGPVRVRDRHPGQHADHAPLRLREAAPRVDRSDQDRDADQRDREAYADRDRGDEEDELDRPEHARGQQVADPPIGVRIEHLLSPALDHTVKSKGARHGRRYGQPYGLARSRSCSRRASWRW
jgi:hypothetical protein